METVTSTLPVGTLLKGKSYSYTIRKILGQGSFGITYLASVKMEGALGSINANVQVAIKEFFMRDINGRDGTSVTSGSKQGVYSYYKNKFIREAQNLSKLNHRNIINVLESFETNNTIYFAMEYIDGGSLDQLINKKGRLSANECVKFSREICAALKFMHSNGMLHLDLKPANIMLRNGSAVLIDFGLSKQYNDNGEPESSTTVGLGTPGYAPIEQSHYHDGKSFPVTMDIYALGATMFKMLTGHRPPEASDILNDGFPEEDLQNANVPSSLFNIVKKCMTPTRKARYQSVDEVLRALNNGETPDDDDEIDVIDVVSPGKISPEHNDEKKDVLDDNNDTVIEEEQNNVTDENIDENPESEEAPATPVQVAFDMWRDRNKFTNIVIIFSIFATTVVFSLLLGSIFWDFNILGDFGWTASAFGLLCIEGELRTLRNRKYGYLPILAFIPVALICIFSLYLGLGYLFMFYFTVIFIIMRLFLGLRKNDTSGFELLRDDDYRNEEPTLASVWKSRHWATNALICFTTIASLCAYLWCYNFVLYFEKSPSYGVEIPLFFAELPLYILFLYSIYLVLKNLKFGLVLIPVCLIILGYMEHIEFGFIFTMFDGILLSLYIVLFLSLLIRKNGRSALSQMEKMF